MKTKLIVFLLLPFTFILSAFAGSATWNLNPVSGDWNAPLNWMPNTVPNSSQSVATFDVSNLTDVVINGATDTVDHIVFTPNASAFTITIGPDVLPKDSMLVFSGTGIINESGVTQNFVTVPDQQFIHPPWIKFQNAATAGDATVFTNTVFANDLPALQFFDNSNAGTATFINQGTGLDFHDDSSANSASFILEGGLTYFYDDSTAANSCFLVQDSGFLTGCVRFIGTSTAGSANFALENGGEASFYDSSTADHATFTVEGANSTNSHGGTLSLNSTATAGDAIITLKAGLESGAEGGKLFFQDSSTAGNSTIIAESGPGPESGGLVQFKRTATGGTARVVLLGPIGPGTLEVRLSPGVTVGSIEGSGLVIISGPTDVPTLSIGSNNLNTTFSGVIQDGDGAGSIGKIGSGTLTLSGANTYTGGTTVTGGVLLISNASGSGTGSGPVTVNGGTLGGSGVISGAMTVGTNTNTASFLAPSKGAKRPATLAVQGKLTLNDDATYLYKLDTKRRVSDQVLAQGATIDNGAKFSLRASGTTQLPLGQVFTVISNTSASAISGRFHNLADGAIVTVNGNNLQASYTGGDGNDLTLTVVP